ncbi:vegetative cell wall protein gp1-like [Fukomys damarensis]|uniref:vegetative cell wall protein gp1-like n=1 Tax=Fukomys damarensis TaxID=885580 RepID=UPI00053F37E3|nr:vegetative cell wall protein gp1-like [Fukomys damarensis]
MTHPPTSWPGGVFCTAPCKARSTRCRWALMPPRPPQCQPPTTAHPDPSVLGQDRGAGIPGRQGAPSDSASVASCTTPRPQGSKMDSVEATDAWAPALGVHPRPALSSPCRENAGDPRARPLPCPRPQGTRRPPPKLRAPPRATASDPAVPTPTLWISAS